MKRLLWIAALALGLASGAAQAGRPCTEEPVSASALTAGLGLAERTARRLDDSGADVVVLARAGQDLTRWRLRWSHLGFAYRERPAEGGAPGVWRVVHKLNHCGGADAALYRQGLGDFFLDQPWRYEAGYAVPSREVQAALLPLLRDDARIAGWHLRAYNMLAYPWALTYQQSNQWAIETLAGALQPAAATRRQAQAWLQLRDYRPEVLNIGPLTRLGARVGSANIAFDDHPNEKRFSDRIETVSADSVFTWLQRSGLGGPLQIVQ